MSTSETNTAALTPSATRRRRSPQLTAISSTVSTLTVRVSRLSLVTVAPMRSSAGMVSGVNDAAMATAGLTKRRAAAQHSRGNGARRATPSSRKMATVTSHGSCAEPGMASSTAAPST